MYQRGALTVQIEISNRVDDSRGVIKSQTVAFVKQMIGTFGVVLHVVKCLEGSQTRLLEMGIK